MSEAANQPVPQPVIGYAGMTHLGINSLAAGAERGFTMVGFDPFISAAKRSDQARVSSLRSQ